MSRALEDLNEAWSADALRAFLEGTPGGDMIRGTVPISYVPPAGKPVPSVAPAP